VPGQGSHTAATASLNNQVLNNVFFYFRFLNRFGKRHETHFSLLGSFFEQLLPFYVFLDTSKRQVYDYGNIKSIQNGYFAKAGHLKLIFFGCLKMIELT
jgi:hypothetical protein